MQSDVACSWQHENKKQTAQVDVTKNKRDKKISKFFFFILCKNDFKELK